MNKKMWSGLVRDEAALSIHKPNMFADLDLITSFENWLDTVRIKLLIRQHDVPLFLDLLSNEFDLSDRIAIAFYIFIHTKGKNPTVLNFPGNFAFAMLDRCFRECIYDLYGLIDVTAVTTCILNVLQEFGNKMISDADIFASIVEDGIGDCTYVRLYLVMLTYKQTLYDRVGLVVPVTHVVELVLSVTLTLHPDVSKLEWLQKYKKFEAYRANGTIGPEFDD